MVGKEIYTTKTSATERSTLKASSNFGSVMDLYRIKEATHATLSGKNPATRDELKEEVRGNHQTINPM